VRSDRKRESAECSARRSTVVKLASADFELLPQARARGTAGILRSVRQIHGSRRIVHTVRALAAAPAGRTVLHLRIADHERLHLRRMRDPSADVRRRGSTLRLCISGRRADSRAQVSRESRDRTDSCKRRCRRFFAARRCVDSSATRDGTVARTRFQPGTGARAHRGPQASFAGAPTRVPQAHRYCAAGCAAVERTGAKRPRDVCLRRRSLGLACRNHRRCDDERRDGERARAEPQASRRHPRERMGRRTHLEELAVR
jgi:hypothetical protein